MDPRTWTAALALATVAALPGCGGGSGGGGGSDTVDRSHNGYVPRIPTFEPLTPSAEQAVGADFVLDDIGLIDIDATPGLDVGLAARTPTTAWTLTRRHAGGRSFSNSGGSGLTTVTDYPLRLEAGNFSQADARVDDIAVTLTSGAGALVHFACWDGLVPGGGTASFPAAADLDASGFAQGDWNHDFRHEVAVSYAAQAQIVVYLAEPSSGVDADMGPGAAFDVVGHEPAEIVGGDFDGDDDDDLAAIDLATGGVIVMSCRGDGTFDPPVALPAAGGARPVVALVAVDFDGDNRLDLGGLRGPEGQADFVVWRGRVGGGFEDPKASTLAAIPGLTGASLAAGELNGDGRRDVAIALAPVDQVLVLLGRGDGTFVEGSLVGVSDEPVGIAIGDVDGDGTGDFAVACRAAHRFDVRWGEPGPP